MYIYGGRERGVSHGCGSALASPEAKGFPIPLHFSHGFICVDLNKHIYCKKYYSSLSDYFIVSPTALHCAMNHFFCVCFSPSYFSR